MATHCRGRHPARPAPAYPRNSFPAAEVVPIPVRPKFGVVIPTRADPVRVELDGGSLHVESPSMRRKLAD